MLYDRSEFLSRFLRCVPDDGGWLSPDSPASPETVAQALSATRDVLGFDAHQEHFRTLAEIIDACVSEEYDLRGNGIAARNATRHPRIIALTKLASEQRAGISAAAAQALAWMEQCQKWVQNATLRNQIAMRVMSAVVVSVGRIRKGYSLERVVAILQIGASFQGSDTTGLRARGAIIEILAGNAGVLPRDKETLATLRQLLDSIVERPNASPAFKAMDTLAALLPDDVAKRLHQASLKWR